MTHMPVLLGHLAVAVAAFLGMEGFAWAVHRYVMHSRWGWGWHASHHVEGVVGDFDRKRWELNDLFAVVFASPAVLLFWVGAAPGLRSLWWAGVGVSAYGVMYAVVHDGLVHQRWPFRFAPKRGYAKRLVQAHRLHHAVRGRDGAVSFGFLYAPEVRKLKARMRALASGGAATGAAAPRGDRGAGRAA